MKTDLEVYMCLYFPTGGFSDTYAALCDFNEIPFREEIQWVSDYCWTILSLNISNKKLDLNKA